jgi:decaprenylphospho-beta-D-ribofuranose 2-oxidase
MPPAEAAVAARAPAPPPTVDGAIAGWGGGPRVLVRVTRATGYDELRAAVLAAGPAGALARGMGRSYGDAAQLRGGLVLDTTRLRSFELDRERGVVTAQAGVTLGELLGALEPEGWVLPVVPGTQHVSVGGAIASDIHGKNHGAAGTFGMHVRALGLLTASGEVLELAPERNGELLAATIGGMGLTGVILWAAITLRPLRSAVMAVDTDRVEQLDDALAVLDGPGGAHRVAWLDLLSHRLVRGVVTRAEHLLEDPLAAEAAAGGGIGAWGGGGAANAAAAANRTTVAARLTLPPRWPGALLRTGVVRAYNEYRFRSTPRHAAGHPEPFGAHMFPLDVLNAWPRLYGAAGFVQYQLVVPRGAERALEQVIARLRRSTVPCYLSVLKDFGDENHAPLSFPLRGWTLTLDLPGSAQGLGALLDAFDDIVAQAGGRVYLAKDGRLRAATLAAMYPRLERWRAVRDQIDPERRWRSDLAVRTGLVEAAR